ncbi:hypothetical protein J31TS4_23420 [Paenibacillus sp. J31TS4]|uniref:hypothetical protein n=1 Tax=Paenibacillus sp. J31TS4 TaxID=2807195 RepID=UPI001B20A096|nr:hypothetical protein [Paenibacillus sp. J31TS4]GIP39062.1 hypothetical protein J31TS4_23420 [Paenibacillus sp. J31TS4]
MTDDRKPSGKEEETGKIRNSDYAKTKHRVEDERMTSSDKMDDYPASLNNVNKDLP